VADGSLHAYLYDHGSMTDLGTFGGYGATPFDVNDLGQLVAGVTLDATGTSSHAIMYANGVVTDLGSLGGAVASPLAVNNDGTVIGWSFLNGQSNMHAFVYRDGKMADLNLLADLPAGWTLSMARDINDAGQIIARGCNGTTGACSWMELNLISPVPEPAAPALFLAGLLPLAWRIGRVRRTARPQ
jgi:probable HAF family extracellular repeat protein